MWEVSEHRLILDKPHIPDTLNRHTVYFMYKNKKQSYICLTIAYTSQ